MLEEKIKAEIIGFGDLLNSVVDNVEEGFPKISKEDGAVTLEDLIEVIKDAWDKTVDNLALAGLDIEE